ncbi:MAG TPA: protein kinase [Opitutaceae bacterium]|nr:protein kinase [Opitutaceae bacterium]
MHLRYARLTTAGRIRESNEDYLDYWQPEDPLVRDRQGSLAVLADGVGGLAAGEVASRLAVEAALETFRQDPPGETPYAGLRRMFAAAATAVHRAAQERGGGPMATTLVAALFRDHAVSVAHAGDSRAYHIRKKTIRRLTRDHVATSLPVKLGLMLERNAMVRPERCQLTRSVGQEPFCTPDLATQFLHHGDFVVQCTDGLHAFVLDDEICQIVCRHHPYDACRELLALAEKRGSDDNISLQIIAVNDWEKVVHSSSPNRSKAVTGTGDLAPGHVLDDRFELTDLVARSNMASIFRAKDRRTGEIVAIKVPLMTLESDVAGFERFQREEEIGTRLNHPGILRVIKVETKSRPYLVMEFLEGETLAQRLARQRPLPETEAAGIAAQICDALAYLHEHGVTHRDLKPQNIMMCRDGSVRLFDFGIAGVKQARRLTFVGFSPTMGTPDYMAPEQVKGKRGDQRTDIYSLGAILYELTTGSAPFQGESPYVVMNARTTGDPVAPRRLNPNLTPVIEEIMLHALERDPDRRYTSAADMKRELENYEAVELVGRFQHLREPQTPGRSRQLWLILAIVVAVQIVLFFILLIFLRSHH